MEFIQTVKELNTPEKIGQYMKDNFEYKAQLLVSIMNKVKLWQN
jgi:hypothetical protein